MDSRIFPHVKCSSAENPNGRLAGVAGFEPAHMGVKVPCLRPLGDTPVCRLMQRRPAEPTCNLDQSRLRSSKRHFRLKHDLMIPSEWGVPISLVYSQTSLSDISTRRHRCQMRRFHSNYDLTSNHLVCWRAWWMRRGFEPRMVQAVCDELYSRPRWLLQPH